MQYESVAQSVRVSMWRVRCRQIVFELRFHVPLAFFVVVYDLKIIGHGNTDNNLE
jgi:hypothetical protein